MRRNKLIKKKKTWIFQGCFCNVIISTHWVTVDPWVEWTWIFSLRKLSCDQSVKKLHVLVLTAASVCLIVLCSFESDHHSVYRRGLCEVVSLRGQPSRQLPVLGWHWGPWQASEAKSCQSGPGLDSNSWKWTAFAAFSPKLKLPFYTLEQATRSNGVIEIRNARVSRLSDLSFYQLFFTAYLSVSIPSSFCC